MPTEYTLEIAGEKYPWEGLYYERDYKFFGKLIDVTIPYWETAILGNDVIIIKREGSAVTKGKVKKILPYEGVEKGIGMQVIGYTDELKHVTLPANARTYNADPATILKDDLGSTDLTEGTINNYGANIAVEFGSADESKFNRKQVHEELAFITGYEMYVNPSSALDFKSQCGVDRSSSIIFKHGDLLEKWAEPHTWNHLVQKTKVVVLGRFEGSHLMYGTAGAGTNVLELSRKNLINLDTCGKAATAIYADAQNVLQRGAFDGVDDSAGAGFDVYDTIRVEDSRFGLAGNFRVYRIERRIGKDLAEHTRIFYTNIAKLTGNGPILLDLENDMLVEGQSIFRDFGQSPIIPLDTTKIDTTTRTLDATGLMTTVGTKAGDIGRIQDKDTDGEYSQRDGTWATLWSDVSYALDGVKFIIKRFQFWAKGTQYGGNPDCHVMGEYRFGAGDWIIAASDTYPAANTGHWVDSGEITTNNEGANNEAIEMRIRGYAESDEGAAVVSKPYIQLQQKQYRRALD